MSTFSSFLNYTVLGTVLNCDASYPWQIGFQDGATPNFEGIVELHDTIFFYLVVITFLVFWMMSVIMIKFSSSKTGIVHKYHNHGTLIELVWTITPAFILIAIAFPSFKLLYLMDLPESIESCTYLATGAVPMLTLKKVPVKKLSSSRLDLVPINKPYSLGSTTGINLNDYVINIIIFPPHIISQIVGHLLGDASLVKSWSSVMPVT